MISHSKPKNIFINKLAFSDKIMENSDFYKYFLTILIFIISLIALSSILTISGLNIENSFKLSVLTLMNTVNSNMTGLGDFNFEELGYLTKYFIIIFMLSFTNLNCLKLGVLIWIVGRISSSMGSCMVNKNQNE